MNETEICFQAQGLVKIFNSNFNVEVLKGVDLQLGRGEKIAIVGMSGTGKSTLLHILGGLDRPDQGALFFGGQNIFQKNDFELSVFRNQRIGFVFQFHHLLPEFTALENVMMPGLIAGVDKENLEQDCRALFQKVGLLGRETHKAGELSGGEQQRVALARALIMKPALLLADEPTGNLDIKTGYKVFELIQEMCGESLLSTVMVTHNPELAGRMDRCLTMRDGRLHA